MDQLFWIQTFVAFVIGGVAISSLTIMAEKAPSSISGIILALPTNMVIALFFLGLVNSPSAVADNIQGVPLTLAGAILYAVVYLLTARFIFTDERTAKYIVIPTALFLALVAWLIFPFLMLYFGVPSLMVNLGVFGVIVIATQYLLIRLVSGETIKQRATTIRHKGRTMLFRSLLAGSVIVTAMIVSKTLGPFWGVVIGSSFPAAYTATLVALHLNSDTNSLLSTAKMLPVGTIGQMFYVLMVAMTYKAHGLWVGTLLAYLLTIGFCVLLAQVSRRLFDD